MSGIIVNEIGSLALGTKLDSLDRLMLRNLQTFPLSFSCRVRASRVSPGNINRCSPSHFHSFIFSSFPSLKYRTVPTLRVFVPTKPSERSQPSKPSVNTYLTSTFSLCRIYSSSFGLGPGALYKHICILHILAMVESLDSASIMVSAIRPLAFNSLTYLYSPHELGPGSEHDTVGVRHKSLAQWRHQQHEVSPCSSLKVIHRPTNIT